MRFNRLDLNLLVALDALLTEQNITRASERLHLSQSAMSGALARLREHFQDELLVQVGRKMTRTALGESLASPVHNILMQVQATVERRATFDPATSNREFSIMVSDYMTTVLMTEAIRRAARIAPGVFDLLQRCERAIYLRRPDAYAMPVERGIGSAENESAAARVETDEIAVTPDARIRVEIRFQVTLQMLQQNPAVAVDDRLGQAAP